MKGKKKINRVRAVKSNSVNYTFIDDVIIQTNNEEKVNDTKKKTSQFVRKTLKDAKTTKTHYKLNSRSPKSQQNHSPVYE